ncbi:MAG: CPBP family glutamic-type intramembrane protease [Verrucomicrobiota bacterium]
MEPEGPKWTSREGSLWFGLWFRAWPLIAVAIGMGVGQSGWAAILLYHAGILVALVRHRDRLRALPWKSSLAGVVLAIMAGWACGPVVYYALPWLTHGDVGKDLAERLPAYGLSGTSWLLFAVYFVTLHPVLEELGWRGILEAPSPKRHHHDGEFAAYHLLVLALLFPGSIVLGVVAFFILASAAWMWRLLRDRYGMSLVIAFHAAADAGIIAATWALFSKDLS